MAGCHRTAIPGETGEAPGPMPGAPSDGRSSLSPTGSADRGADYWSSQTSRKKALLPVAR